MSGDSTHAPPRRARPSDAEAVTALVRRAYGKFVPRIGREPLPMTADYRKAIVEHELWVLEERRAPVAVLELIPGADDMLIENIAVDPPHQGRGLGRILLDWAEAEARRQGFAALRLYTNATFVENIALYQRFGYRESEREAFRGGEIVHMRKPLA